MTPAIRTADAPVPRPSPRPILLPCPRCGETDASITLDLAGLGDNEELTCRDCDATFGLADVRDIIERWGPILLWVESAPFPPPEA